MDQKTEQKNHKNFEVLPTIFQSKGTIANVSTATNSDSMSVTGFELII